MYFFYVGRDKWGPFWTRCIFGWVCVLFLVSKLAHLNQQFLLCLHEYKEKTCTLTTVLVILTRGECLNNCLSMRVGSFFEDPFFWRGLSGIGGGRYLQYSSLYSSHITILMHCQLKSWHNMGLLKSSIYPHTQYIRALAARVIHSWILPLREGLSQLIFS